MTKQTFTTGQILTASQLTSLQQTAMGGGSTTAKTASYTLVAADAGTVVQMNSASATTITVNQSLFAAGDEVNIQNVGAGVCTVTAGTATVSTAGSLALSQYEGGQLYFNTTSAALFFDIVQSSGMTNPLTTTGDIIYSSSGTTPARLGIGSSAQVLTVASGIPSWATPAAGGAYTSLASGSITNGLSLTSISGSYTDLYLQINNACPTANDQIGIRINNNSTSADYVGIIMRNITGTGATVQQGAWAFVDISGGSSVATSTSNNSWVVYFPNYAATTNWKTAYSSGGHNNNLSTFTSVFNSTLFKSTSAITRLDFKTAGSDWANQGTYTLYGVK